MKEAHILSPVLVRCRMHQDAQKVWVLDLTLVLQSKVTLNIQFLCLIVNMQFHIANPVEEYERSIFNNCAISSKRHSRIMRKRSLKRGDQTRALQLDDDDDSEA